MTPTKTSITLALTLVCAITITGCAGSAGSAPKAAVSSESVPSPTADATGESQPNKDETQPDDPDNGQVSDFTSVIEVPTLYSETVSSIFDSSPLKSKDFVVTHDEAPFVAELDVVTQRPLDPHLGAQAVEPEQPEESPQKIAVASDVVNTYFTAVMNAMETGDASQLGKIAWEGCDLCSDTRTAVKKATDPKTYENAQVHYSGLVFPNSPIEFVRTDGVFYHFKSSAVERSFFTNVNGDPWIVRGDDAGNFVMDIVVAHTSEGWKMLLYGVTSLE